MSQDVYTLPLVWMRAEMYCSISGEPMDTIRERIRSGDWAAGQEYKRTSPKVLWINVPKVTAWVSQQPHAEAHCPKGLNSGKARVKAA